MSELDLSLAGDDLIFHSLSAKTVTTARKEVRRALGAAETTMVKAVSTGLSSETQKFQDLQHRLENLRLAHEELVQIEAKARLRKRDENEQD